MKQIRMHFNNGSLNHFDTVKRNNDRAHHLYTKKEPHADAKQKTEDLQPINCFCLFLSEIKNK